ncbi:hypothetical protein ZEAMMB73_Zm00001d050670 [Zea mays]|nr:hypothetical protein ZEAMMB73_Zm00001d050670 [Zea mays]
MATRQLLRLVMAQLIWRLGNLAEQTCSSVTAINVFTTEKLSFFSSPTSIAYNISSWDPLSIWRGIQEIMDEEMEEDVIVKAVDCSNQSEEMNEERKVNLLGLADILSASIGGFSWAPLISKICKNKVKAEAWFTGLSALICRGQHGSQVQHIDGIRIAGIPFDGARESSLSGSSTFTSDSFENKLSSVNSTKDRSSGEYTYSERTDVSDMQLKSVSSSDIRISVSSALSTSSHGSMNKSHQASSSGRSLSYFLLNMIEASEVILGKHVLENHIDQMSTDEVEQSINR